MDNFIPEREASHVAPGDVASQYSPAAYLTELWKNAKTLHPVNDPRALSTRRPDIGNLLLSQDNMDNEVSALELSNKLLSSHLLLTNLPSEANYHQPAHTLRGILSRLPADEPGLFNNNDVADFVCSGGIQNLARYILIRRTPQNTVNAYMGFTEVEVFSGGNNIAPGKTVTTSTNLWFPEEEGYHLIDGTKYQHAADTNTIVSGDCWFLVDLGTEYPIDSVVLYGRNNDSDVLNRERDMTLFALPASALPDNIGASPASMPSYSDLINKHGVLSHSWTTTNDDGQVIQSGVNSTYTLPGIDHSAADIWRLTHLHGVKEEDARVMCGKNISMVPGKNEVTGESVPSQFERLFGRQGETLLASTDLTEQGHILKAAFGVNDDGLVLLASLAGGTPGNNMTLTQISALYAWVLLSRSLSYSLAELSILNNQVSQVPVANVSGRYLAFRSAGMWLDEQHLSVTGLGGLTAPDQAMSGPVMDTLTDTLKRECTTKEGLTRHKLAEAVSATFGLSSGSQADALLGWLDSNIPAGNMNSNGLMGWAGSPELNRTVRYVMLRSGNNDRFDIAEVEVMSGGRNVAQNKTVSQGTQGNAPIYPTTNLVDGKDTENESYAANISSDNAWLMIDLEQEYVVDSIKLTPRAIGTSRMTNCYVYVSDTDMSTWAGNSKPGDTDSRYPLVGQTASAPQPEAQSFRLYTDAEAALYLGRLLRYTLVANALGLTESIVATLGSHPAMLGTEGQLSFSLSRLRALSQLQLLARRCGTHAPAFLQQLSENTLKLSDLEQYLGVDNTTLTAALPADQQAADSLTFSAVAQMVETLQLSQSTGLSLTGIAKLRALSLSTSFPEWETTATFLINELPASARTSVQQKLAEELSMVLSHKLAQQNNTLPEGSLKKDADYFLIDPQLSGQTLTSPLAWSIAAVQLYIDRCLNGDEPDVISTARDVQFFEDWDRYNKRYSQWAGLQQLLWEPENFIDPSQRLSQTEAFGHLLQKLDGQALNEDTAQEAFASYLTEFEEMAEIIPVSGWHDSPDPESGLVWILGISRNTPVKWYYRSVDISKLTAGALSIHAWTGWQSIDVAASPVMLPGKRPLIHLLMVNHRLQLVWLESAEKSASPASSATSETVPYYTLKSSQQRYDGSWSAPSSGVDLPDYTGTSRKDMALACNVSEEKLQYAIFSAKDGMAYGLLDRNGQYFSSQHVPTNDRGDSFTSASLLLSDGFPIGAGYPQVGPHSGMMGISFDGRASWMINYNKEPLVDYPLSNDFPLKLADLNGRGTAAVFALTEERKNRTDLNQQVDFNGTFGPYYWELFYHVPLLISQRLKQQQDYTAATRWLEYVFKPAGYEWGGAVRYVMLRRGDHDNFDIAEVEVMCGGYNVALNMKVSQGPQGNHNTRVPGTLVNGKYTDIDSYAANNASSNAWVQIDLGTSYIVDNIQLTPRPGYEPRMTNCYVYVSDTDMSTWAGNSNPGDTDSRYPLVGQTAATAQTTAQSLSVPKYSAYWNPLSLESDTAWGGMDGYDVIPANVTDPDVIAEGDPMHYKLATFMLTLDLLIARGDTAYRQLERDTLVEAGMWYQKAQRLLGEQPVTPVSSTTLPVVSMATENDFKPQENEKLNGYWQQLRQRLYNLRHNLTLDGQPMNLPLYAKPANPADLLSAALAAANGQADLSGSPVGQLRFGPALEQARNLAGQLIQFGSTLQGITERQDAEAMNQMLQSQGSQLLMMTIEMQKRTLESLDADLAGLEAQRSGIETRQAYYQTLYDENISSNERSALALNETSAALLIAGGVSHTVGGGLDMAPNTFGLAVGGSRWGALANGIGAALSNSASALSTTAGVLTQQDAFTRRRGEWKLQLDSIKSELVLLDKQVESLTIRRDAADMQQTYLQTQQRQAVEQLQFLKSKFTNQQLYSWMRSRLAGIFWQFYDVAISAGLRAEKSYQFETGESSQRFIRPGAWQSSTGGLLCGESLLLDLAHMEEAWLAWTKRALEVTRTVSLASVLKTPGLTAPSFSPAVPGFSAGIQQLLSQSTAQDTTFEWTRTAGSKTLRHVLKTGTNGILSCEINLAELNIPGDYPSDLGAVRRIKNISVSLPALVGPYQDIQAVLSYSESGFVLPAGCGAIAVSHGVNDSGQFQLDFNDPYYLPFEGVSLPAPEQDNAGTLTLQFPNAWGKQQELLKSLNDVILHIRYTIRD